tara:strand:- start:421 stop:774 length:354 start_codon:yes stop_codon:yes gene_type:complete
MHGSGPALLILAKREVAGDELPDFSGDSMVKAKKKMLDGESESAVPQSHDKGEGEKKYSEDPHMAMKEMAEELYKASKMHAGQADKLIEICEDMYGKEHGEHKAAGHNPHGKGKDLY